jgi:hypothetical protein
MLIDLNDEEMDFLFNIFRLRLYYSKTLEDPVDPVEMEEMAKEPIEAVVVRSIYGKLKDAKVEDQVEKITEKMMAVRFILQKAILELLEMGYLDEVFIKDPKKEESFISDFILKYCIKEGTWDLDFPSKSETET